MTSPVIPLDLTNPQTVQRRQDHVASARINLFGLDKLFGIAGQPLANMDWPNPTRLRDAPGVAVRSRNTGFGQMVNYPPPVNRFMIMFW